MLAVYVWIKNLFNSEEGQDLVEYALLLGLIALICVVALTAAGGAVNRIWEAIQAALEGVPAGAPV